MSGVDKTSPSRLRDPLAIKGTTQELPQSIQLTCTLTWTLESRVMAGSRCQSRDHPSSPSTRQPRKECATVSSEHPEKGQKRKYQEEGGDGAWCEEPAQAWKKLKQEQHEIEVGDEEPGKSQIWKPQGKGQLQLKAPECAKGPEEEAVTEGSVGGGKGLKHPYSNREEGVQKHHKVECPGLLEHLQPGVYVSSGPHNAHTSTMDTSKNIKCCVEGQNHESETPQICTDSVSNGMPNNKVSTPEVKKKTLEDQEKARGLDHSPDITVDMEKEIGSALGPGSKDEILSCAFKLQITRADLWTLKKSQWLNDNVINFYMNLLMERNQSQGYPALHAFNTFFYTKLKCGGYGSVKRWTRAVNLFAKELILVPVHLDVHWSLVVTDLRKKSIVYLDSMGQKRPDILELIFCYLQDESKARRNRDLSPSQWKQYSMPAGEIPQQLNGSDCGVFTCKYADYLSRDQPITFSQQHMPLFRKKMVWEILHKRLL